MKHFLRLFIITVLLGHAFNSLGQEDRKSFSGRLYNQELDVYFVIDLHGNGIMVPGHDIYGPLAGYIGKGNSSFYWLVVDSEIKDGKAIMQMVNDYGSEDLTVTLQQLNDSTYRMTQGKGSVIKLPNNGKWMKLPSTVEFKKNQKL